MRCKTAQPLISLDLDRRLPADRAKELEAHLAGCERCRTLARTMSRAVDLLGSAPAAPSAPDDWRVISARLEERGRGGLRAWLADLWDAAPGRLATAGVLSIFLVAGSAAGVWLSKGLKPSMPVEAVAMAEAFGDVPGSSWLAGEVKP
ncbi:MAG TPA: zf-HC2 domain-containing protein [Myxococcales bacterium]|jgi:anti-sigma factor RsiW